ncbi:MAG TPA: plastocyanin/azurin family copper-binding protein [Ktedonobacterales bacterium]|nr:plastocyanin/azurin family copper-binding protein [Ktedonobacterales bacterium]
MKKVLFPLTMLAFFILAGCGATSAAQGGAGGGNAAGPATITMDAANFQPNNGKVTVQAGRAVTFKDPAATGGLHILVVGVNGKLTSQAGAPAELNTPMGLTINAGDTKPITFATAGTYKITCTIHPYMEVTVVVTA